MTFSFGSLGDLFTSQLAWGIACGLVLGKPIGVLSFSWLAVRLRLARLPETIAWRQILAIGILAGIGFTVSVFISSLAFDDPSLLPIAKIAVLASSLVAGVGGYLALRLGTIPVTAHASDAAQTAVL